MEAWGTPDAYRDLMRVIRYKRIGEPDDIGRACVWVASDDSDSIHGSGLSVDGGMTLYPGLKPAADRSWQGNPKDGRRRIQCGW